MSQSVKGTYAFVSLGCPKNTVDSERMIGKLAQEGYALTPDADGADVVVVNTCGFIEPARQESLGVIRATMRVLFMVAPGCGCRPRISRVAMAAGRGPRCSHRGDVIQSGQPQSKPP